VLFFAHLAGARIRMQVDVAFGDAVTPEAKEITYPTILDFPAPRIRAYPIASVISEKLQTMVAFGMPNSRMKDYFDIWILAQEFPFEGIDLVNAIRATFDRRRTEIPKLVPLNRIGFKEKELPLSDVMESLRKFLIPLLVAASQDIAFSERWEAGGPWSGR
jgi:hypothetical protein